MKKSISLFLLLLFSFNNSYIFSCQYGVERTPAENEINTFFNEYLKNTPGNRSKKAAKEDFKGYIRVLVGCKNENQYAGNFKYFEKDEFYSILNFENAHLLNLI